jgi:hypothetical protein
VLAVAIFIAYLFEFVAPSTIFWVLVTVALFFLMGP